MKGFRFSFTQDKTAFRDVNPFKREIYFFLFCLSVYFLVAQLFFSEKETREKPSDSSIASSVPDLKPDTPSRAPITVPGVRNSSHEALTKSNRAPTQYSNGGSKEARYEYPDGETEYRRFLEPHEAQDDQLLGALRWDPDFRKKWLDAKKWNQILIGMGQTPHQIPKPPTPAHEIPPPDPEEDPNLFGFPDFEY